MVGLVILSAVAAGLGIFAVVVSRQAAKAEAPKHEVGATGWVEADPRVLALAAGVSDNVYALASMMRSEAGNNLVLQIACGWVAKNMAARQGVSVFKLLTRAGKNKPGTHTLERHASYGFYGPQNVGPRYASTRLAPTPAAIANAESVLSGEVDDPTEGCTQFDAPKAQDSMLAAGIAGYEKTAVQVQLEREKGAELVMLPGITSTRFWRPKVA